MESKAIIIADLVAGLLIGMQFLLTKEKYKSWDEKLLKKLQVNIFDSDSFKIRTMLIPGSLTAVIMFGIIIHGTIVDLTEGALNVGHVLLSAVSLTGGMIIAIGIMFLVVWIKNRVRRFRKFNPMIMVYLVGMVLGIALLSVFIMVVGRVSTHIIALIAAFAVGVMLMGVWAGGMRYIQQYLTFTKGVLIRLGILIFVGSKLLQLIYI